MNILRNHFTFIHIPQNALIVPARGSFHQSYSTQLDRLSPYDERSKYRQHLVRQHTSHLPNNLEDLLSAILR